MGDDLLEEQWCEKMTEEEKGRVIYQRLENGIEVFDAEYYNKPMIDFARNVHNAFIATAIFLALMFVVFVAVPFFTGLVHSMMCSVPNWPVAGGCP